MGAQVFNPYGEKIARGFVYVSGQNLTDDPIGSIQNFGFKKQVTLKEAEVADQYTAGAVAITGHKYTCDFESLILDNNAMQLFFGGTADTTTAVTDPTVAPTLTAAAGSTSFLAGYYAVGYTYTTFDGQSKVSTLATVNLTAGQQINVTALGALPTGATGVRWFMSSQKYTTSALALAAPVYMVANNTGGAFSITTLPSATAPTPPALSSLATAKTRYVGGVNDTPLGTFTLVWKTPDASGNDAIIAAFGCVSTDLAIEGKLNDYMTFKGNINIYGAMNPATGNVEVFHILQGNSVVTP